MNELDSKLIKACIKGNLEEVKVLVEKGADIHREEALWLAAHAGQLEVVKFLIEKGIKFLEEKI